MRKLFEILGLLILILSLAPCCVFEDRGPKDKDIKQASKKHDFIKAPAKKKSWALTVFVHGTVGSTLNIFNPFQCYHDCTEEDTYCNKVIRRYRNHHAMQYDQVLGDEGLCIFESCKFDPLIASCYLVPAYDEIARAVGNSCDIEEYASFGWSGLLSQKARRDAGLQFYKELQAYRERIVREKGVEPIIRIITHSHGGNVALWIAQAELELQKHLSIDLLFMYGAPMQIETAPLIASPLFRRIILGYSWGDSVQRRDCFSTAAHKSFMRMGDITNLKQIVTAHPGCMRCDIRFAVNDNERLISHTNMWLCGRSEPVFKDMDPLPLMVLTPLIVKALDSKGTCCTHLKVKVCSDTERYWVCTAECLDAPKNKPIGSYFIKCQKENEAKTIVENHHAEKEIRDIIVAWSRRMKQEWRAFDGSRDVLFNRKNREAIHDAIFGKPAA
ncbi:TPA: hypothetical protein DDZ86_00075 [Candidatus Dependentiae bacterium]|nr:MAG: hypothetical protein UW09_C0002G0104 [candidate division TM6 bacterium GW2011_GWF2_43_87]HBL98024.1 hypothetical protein [Candidatus Dependentiae bacterium]